MCITELTIRTQLCKNLHKNIFVTKSEIYSLLIPPLESWDPLQLHNLLWI